MEGENRNNRPEEDFRHALTSAAGENSALREFISAYINIKAAVKTAESPEKKEVILPPVAENAEIDYLKFYREAVDEYVAKVLSSPTYEQAGPRIFKRFLENLEGRFAWGEKNSDVNASTLAICTLDSKNDSLNENNDNYPGEIVGYIGTDPAVISISTAPISKKWAAILMLNYMCLAYLQKEFFKSFRDAAQRDAAASIMSIFASLDLIEQYDRNKNFLNALKQIIQARKIKSTGDIAALLKDSKLKNNELDSLEKAMGGDSREMSVMERKAHQDFFLDSLTAAFIVAKIRALPDGQRVPLMIELYREILDKID